MDKISKTLICVAIAGLLFITTVIYNYKPLFLIAAFFDWLPLPTGWMKISGSNEKVRKAGMLHGIVTLIAYIIGIAWLFTSSINGIDLGYLFLETWFIAVILGAYTTSRACM